MFAAILWLAACGLKEAPVPPMSTPTEPAVVRTSASTGAHDPAFAALLEAHWEHRLRQDPLGATELGDARFDASLHPTGPEAAAADRSARDGFRARLAALRPGLLHPDDRLTAAILGEQLDASAAMDVCATETWGVTARGTPLVWLLRLPELHDPNDPAAARSLAARIDAAPATIDGEITSLRAGLTSGRVADAESVQRAVTQLDQALADPETFRWAEPFSGAPAVAAALARYRDLLRDEILPRARSGAHVGASGLPNGDACYRAAIRLHTTLPLTPEEVAAAGHAELAAIHAEMRTIGRRLWGIDDLPTLFTRLREDPSLRFRSAEEILTFAEERLRQAEAATASVLITMPTTPCSVMAIPDHEAPWTYVAYYRPPEPGRNPGFYAVNTYLPETRLRHEAAALAFHESVPGHHTQIALAQELQEVPAFRRHAYLTAYAEGWALYAERLADELGLYPSDLERLGMLSFASWRASRLVVDEGLHHQGWTRDQAIDFMLTHTALARNNVENEVDRYVTWPGQALGYQIGQLEIRRLRAEAQGSLGDRFTLPGFHDAILGAGPLPLPLLGERVAAWVNAQGT